MKKQTGNCNGWDFSQVIEGGSHEDIDYILDKFLEAINVKGLHCGGGVSPVNIDTLYCEHCFKPLSENEEDYGICFKCFDEMARELGYHKPSHDSS